MTPWTMRLIVANVAMFMLTMHGAPGVGNDLVFRPGLVLAKPWTLVTYMFLHGGWSHLIFNMLVLFFFGPRVEERLGGRHFLGLYFTAGIVGALMSIPIGAPIVGASAGMYGVSLAFAYYWPRERIFIWGIVPVEARWLVVGMTVIALWYGFNPGTVGGRGIAHFAHLGGYIGGFLYLKTMEWRSPARQFRSRATAVARAPVAIVPADSADMQRWATIPRDELHEINRDEVDRLFSKIEVGGIRSLTPEERASLDRFSRA